MIQDGHGNKQGYFDLSHQHLRIWSQWLQATEDSLPEHCIQFFVHMCDMHLLSSFLTGRSKGWISCESCLLLALKQPKNMKDDQPPARTGIGIGIGSHRWGSRNEIRHEKWEMWHEKWNKNRAWKWRWLDLNLGSQKPVQQHISTAFHENTGPSCWIWTW